MLKSLQTKIIITDKKHFSQVQETKFDGTILLIEDIITTKINELALYNIREQQLDIDPLYSIFTSGSTGIPKQVVVNHNSTIDFIDNFTMLFDINSNDVIGNQSPFDFDISIKDIFCTLKVGATLQIIPKKYFSFPTTLLDFLEDKKITTLIWAVSALCIISQLDGFSYRKPKHIKNILFSGELMPINHLNIWRKAYPNAQFVNLYGPTEITCNCMFYIVDKNFNRNEQLPLGKNFPNKSTFLLDDNDNLITKNTPNILGEICVIGTGISLGYYNNFLNSKEVFLQNPLNNSYYELIYKTGDLAQYKNDGNLYFVSRKDNQIKHMGYRIDLEEIERELDTIECITRSCCIYDKTNKKIVAFYVGTINKDTIFNKLKNKLSKIMIPNLIFKVEHIPLNKNGKLDRKGLLNNYMSKGV